MVLAWWYKGCHCYGSWQSPPLLLRPLAVEFPFARRELRPSIAVLDLRHTPRARPGQAGHGTPRVAREPCLAAQPTWTTCGSTKIENGMLDAATSLSVSAFHRWLSLAGPLVAPACNGGTGFFRLLTVTSVRVPVVRRPSIPEKLLAGAGCNIRHDCHKLILQVHGGCGEATGGQKSLKAECYSRRRCITSRGEMKSCPLACLHVQTTIPLNR